MTIPQGNVWQELRARSLDVLPDGCQFRPSAPPTFRRWLEGGAYSVSRVNGRALCLHASSFDIGALLFAEAGLLLDHAQEHALQLRLQLRAGIWSSPAWATVSMYYWAYYSVLALSRMIGIAPWFLTDADTSILKGLATPDVKLGPGPYVLTCGTQESLTMRAVELRRSSQTRLHDAVWRTWFDFLRQLTSDLVRDKSNAEELRLYLPQVLSANALGNAWPSDCRNLINYIPGLAYGAARGKTPTSTHFGLSANRALTSNGVISRLESDSAAIMARLDIRDQLGPVTKLLTSMTFALDAIAHTLFAEVVDRRGVDRRWVNARKQLRHSQWSTFESAEWPTTTAA